MPPFSNIRIAGKKIKCPHCLESFKVVLEPTKKIDQDKKEAYLSSHTVPYHKFKKVIMEKNKYKERLIELGEIQL